MSTRLDIPSSLLIDRDIFPVSTPVSFEVILELPDRTKFTAEFSLEFLLGAIEVKIDIWEFRQKKKNMNNSSCSYIHTHTQTIATPDPGYTFAADEILLIDLSTSVTVDGVGLDEGVWEWEWRCQFALTEEDCRFGRIFDFDFSFHFFCVLKKKLNYHLLTRYEDGSLVVLPTGPVFESDEV